MEADDDGTYVVKFRGAGQGRKALVAEVICAGLARACGLAVPDLVAVELDPALAPGEPDQEIQDLLRASGGTEPGRGLPARRAGFRDRRRHGGRRTGRPHHLVRRAGRERGPVLAQPEHAAVARPPLPDRSWRGADIPAPLVAAAAAAAERPYDIAEHALLGCGALVEEADAELAPLVTEAVLADAVAAGSRRVAGRGSGVRQCRRGPCGLRRAASGAAGGTATLAPAPGRRRPGRAGQRDDRRSRRTPDRQASVADPGQRHCARTHGPGTARSGPSGWRGWPDGGPAHDRPAAAVRVRHAAGRSASGPGRGHQRGDPAVLPAARLPQGARRTRYRTAAGAGPGSGRGRDRAGARRDHAGLRAGPGRPARRACRTSAGGSAG